MNIFENAKFGDKFRTRDERMAIFYNAHLSSAREGSRYVECLLEPKENAIQGLFAFRLDGTAFDTQTQLDIIGKWEERDKEIIDKACEWLKRELADPMPEELYKQWCNEKIADFRKTMEE